MPDDLDLSGTAAEPEAKKEPGRKKEGGDASQVYSRVDRGERAWEKDLRGRLERTLERLGEWLEGRGDQELATVVKEDSKAMIGGVIALARPATWLRPLLVTVLTVVEPLLAFGRLARILLRRLGARRARNEQEAWEREQEEAAAAARPEEDVEPVG